MGWGVEVDDLRTNAADAAHDIILFKAQVKFKTRTLMRVTARAGP